MTVLDASAVLAVILVRPGSAALKARLREDGGGLHAPHLLDIEVLHVIRRRLLLGQMDEHRSGQAIGDLVELPVHRHPHFPFAPRIWELRHNLTAYDAVYVALAEALEANLLTCDLRLATAAKGLVSVETFG